jgi:hypothetical protein
MKRLLVLILLLILSSCATPSTMMVNPGTGQVVNCATMGWGVLGSMAASEGHRNCVEAMRTVGWVTAEEYNQAIAGK